MKLQCGCWYILIAFLIALTGCSTFFTYPEESNQRVRLLKIADKKAPIQGELTIHWSDHAIPFIEAEKDEDLPFGIGVSHAHLRLDQMESLRVLSHGKLSEVAGPIGTVLNIDHAIRILDLAGSAKRSIEKMTPQSLAWMRSYTEGINWYIEKLGRETVTNRFLNLPLKKYSLEEVVTISRLVTADINWITYLKFIKLSEQKGWEEVFRYILKKRDSDTFSVAHNGLGQIFEAIKFLSKSGSNSVVVSGKRSKSGSALIASDPHVGLMLPNFWILTGIKSPNYHAFGLMMPGVPVIGVGRNKDIAWGGTNMRAISSHLYNVSQYDKNKIKERSEIIKRRFWFDSELIIRETEFGPIITDSKIFDREKLPYELSLDWVGREGTDEIDAFLKVTRSKNWEDFSLAFENYKVSAMNMLFADKEGNIGMVAAYGQPILKDSSKTLDFIKEPNNPIVQVKKPTMHPNPYNPKEGFIASANNKPFANPEVPFAYTYSSNGRINRIHQIMEETKSFDIGQLKQLQLDVFSDEALKLNHLYKQAIESNSHLSSNSIFYELFKWDGRFDEKSKGALLFFCVSYWVWQDYLQRMKGSQILKKEIEGSDNWKSILITWLKDKELSVIVKAIERNRESIEEISQKYSSWGVFTKQKQAPILGLLPVIGSRFEFESVPVSGASDTINKYGRKLSLEPEEVTYGASARHISDLSSLDENYFILNGGQDSWLHNENLADQVSLWRRGEYIKIPLSMKKVRKQFNLYKTIIQPLRQEMKN